MKTRPIATLAAVCALGLGLAGAAVAGTGRDLRSCYAFSDSFPPVAPDAPVTDFIDIAGVGTPLSLSDDTPSAPVGLPFAFEFFGELYTTVSVSPNGFLRFGPEEVPTARWQRGSALPDARSPNNILAALWKDLDPSRGGSVTYATLGTTPARRFLVQFTNVPDALRLTVLNTFQIALVESSNEIVVRYASAFGGDDGAAAGIEDGTGTAGVTWLLGNFALDRAAVRYAPLRGDSDFDGWVDCIDDCRLVSNFDQTDSDLDGTGDACDLDGPALTVGSGVSANATNKNVDATRPSVAVDATGNAVVVWDGPIDGDARGIAGRWYAPGGAPLGAAFRVNATVPQDQTAPDVTVTPAGGFAVTWGSSDGVSKESSVRLQRYAGGGAPLGGEQLVSLPSKFSAALPAIDVDAGGTLGVGWGARYDSPQRTRPIQLQRIDSLGQPLGGPLTAGVIDAGTTPPQPDLAYGAAGDVTIAWCGETGDALRVQRYDANGAPFTSEPVLLARSACDFPLLAALARGPRLAASAGSVFTVWQEPGAARVLMQRLDAGAPVFAEPLALETPSGTVGSPAVTAWGAGHLFAVWQQGARIFGQRLASDGRALEPPFAVSTSSAAQAVHEMPAVAATPDGQVAVVWRDRHDGAVDVGLRQMRRCGNGNVDPGEQCDDGNAVAGDCCSPTCQLEPDGQACEDGRFCTLDTVCGQGACVGGTPRDCTDADACTADRCDEPSARCVNDAALLTGVACDDGNACTQQDACGSGSCQGSPVVCDDGNVCTTDTCDPAVGCGVTNANGVACDDGDQCTDTDVCNQGDCAGTRVCGPNLPPGGSNGGGSGGGGSGGGGTLPALSASRKGVIKVTCIGPRRSSCRSLLFQADAVTGAAGGQIAKQKQAKIGKKGQVVLKIKLNKAGRTALAAAGNQLPVVLDTTVTDSAGTARQTFVTALLTGRTKR